MGWFDWVRILAGKVTTSIKTGLRGIIELPEEIEPYIPTRPATLEQIDEALEAAAYSERFIQEALPDEALRLARGVLQSEKLTNVFRNRQWTAQSIESIQPGPGQQLSVRAVVLMPDGQMTHVDVAFPTEAMYNEDEFIRRAASALEDDFASQYDVSRSDIIRNYVVAKEPYIQTFPKI